MSEMSPTRAQFLTMSCCLDWSSPSEIGERLRSRGDHSSSVPKVLSELMCEGWLALRVDGKYCVMKSGRVAMHSYVDSGPGHIAAREGLVALLAAGMATRFISRSEAEARGLLSHFKAALAGGLIRHAGYETTVAADDWLNSTEGQAALTAKGLINDH